MRKFFKQERRYAFKQRTEMEITSIIYKPLYSIRDMAQASPTLRQIECALFSFSYIVLLLLFAHIDIFIDIVNSKTTPDIQQLFVIKHSNFVSFLANWGILLMLYLDLFIGDRLHITKAVNTLNIFGVLAIICIFWLSAGSNLDVEIAKSIGAVGQPECLAIAFMAFVMILYYLKYISLKPLK